MCPCVNACTRARVWRRCVHSRTHVPLHALPALHCTCCAVLPVLRCVVLGTAVPGGCCATQGETGSNHVPVHAHAHARDGACAYIRIPCLMWQWGSSHIVSWSSPACMHLFGRSAAGAWVRGCVRCVRIAVQIVCLDDRLERLVPFCWIEDCIGIYPENPPASPIQMHWQSHTSR